MIRITGADAVLVDADTALEEHDVVIAGDEIIRVEATREALPHPDEQIVQLSGGWITAGLIDAHSHLTLHVEAPERDEYFPATSFLSARAARDTLNAGVTTCRDLGGHQHVDIELKAAVARGDVPGPRILAAGKPIVATGGHIHYFGRPVDGPYEARKAVREQVRAGADLIKVMLTGGSANVDEKPELLQLREDEFDAIVTEAKSAGVPVAVHAHSSAAVVQAARAGVDTIEHAALLGDDGIQAMLDADCTLVPTQAVYRRIAENVDGWSQAVADNAARLYEAKLVSVSKAIAAGVRIGVGTDSGRHFPHGWVRHEMQALVEAGLSMTAAFNAATVTNAFILGLAERIGAIRSGMRADLLVLDGDPRQSFGVLDAPQLVISRGVLHDVRKDVVAPMLAR